MMGKCEQDANCLRILHLEDDASDAELIGCSIEEHKIPCSISRVYTRAAFEAAIQLDGIDLILSDSQLLGFDAIATLSRAREMYPGIPFIFFSGDISPKVKEAALLASTFDFITKEDLPRLVRTFISLRSQSNRDVR
jgi:phosphoserine phosphatase RsbU/P